MRRMSHRIPGRIAVVAGLLLLWPSCLAGQGRDPYVNFESPQTHPIEVFTLGGHDYLAVCNTRNNSIEIWDTDETAPNRRLLTMRVGLEPVSLRFNATLSRLFVVNTIGDSISILHLGAPDGPASLVAVHVETTHLGDAPLDVAFYPRDQGGSTRETFLVTHSDLDAFGWRDAITLDPVGPGLELVPAVVTVGVDTTGNGQVDDFVDRAVKEPRAIRVRGDTVVIQALKGGDDNPTHIVPDLDLYCDDLTDPFVNPVRVEGLGTTGFNLAFDSGGDLYAVGFEALNEQLRDEPDVAAAPTGFVKSMFYRIQAPCSGNPTILRRDVNLKGDATPQPPDQALSMLTDLVVFEDGSPVPKVYFTALGNDRVGVIEPDLGAPDPNQWKITRIDVPPANGNPLAGPNGLALKHANPGMANDPGARVYVLNHFDNSIATIDPASNSLVAGGDLSLAHDPRPGYLTKGQRFLYDAKLSGTGFVSCASCHISGRTDGLRWDLGTPGAGAVPIPGHLPDAIEDVVFPEDKEFMVTQSLQGLLNFELAPIDQDLTTNAPYHWRGDRETFLDFRPAFESLLLGPELPPADMEAFEEFVNTIHYPPNPKQARDRVPSGDFGLGEDLALDGSSGAHRGAKIFHLKSFASMGDRSCALCHTLPEGSNNRLTDGGPIESAALRGLFQKEAKRDVDGSSDPVLSPYTGFKGLVHNGQRGSAGTQLANATATINAFLMRFFETGVCGGAGPFCPDLQDLNQFVHELDWGMGPLVGCPMTIDVFNVAQAYPGGATQGCDAACADVASTLDCMEQQAGAANSAVAVHGWDSGSVAGYWYDPITDLYVEEPAGLSLDRSALLDRIGGRDRYVFQAVPLGSERRVSAPTGIPSAPADGPPPTEVELLGLAANSFYQRVPELTAVVADLDNSVTESIFVHTLRLYLWGLILEAPAENGFGVGTGLHHDAPRRFQVTGRDIAHGAELVLALHDDPNAGPPSPDLPVGQLKTRLISLPLYATDRTSGSGLPIWQTAAELDPLTYYALMLGGENAPGVTQAFFDQAPFTFPMVDPVLDKPQPDAFDPLAWNWVYVTVVNPDGDVGDGGWQRLRVE